MRKHSSLKWLCSFSLQKLMHSCSNELVCRISNPKISCHKKRDHASAWFTILQAVSVARISGAVATHQDADLAALLLCAQATAAKDDIDLVAQV